MRVQVPPENLAVALPLFGLVWSRAERLLADESGAYAAGVVAACRWLARYGDTPTPIHHDQVLADPDSIQAEDMLATGISMMFASSDRSISQPYAAGVANTLGWARGTLTALPLDLPAAVAS